jgi:hypothetical protein
VGGDVVLLVVSSCAEVMFLRLLMPEVAAADVDPGVGECMGVMRGDVAAAPAGVPTPVNGEMAPEVRPEGGTGMEMSSGDPGMR